MNPPPVPIPRISGGGMTNTRPAFTVPAAEAGAVLDRRFDYYERNFEYKGGSAGFARAGLRFGF